MCCQFIQINLQQFNRAVTEAIKIKFRFLLDLDFVAYKHIRSLIGLLIYPNEKFR